MRILLADDHRLVRDGLEAVLAKEPGLTVVGAADDGEEAVAKVAELRPDVVVMDVSMPGSSGIEATRRIMAASREARVIALSMHADCRYVQAMLEAGAAGYLLKNAASDELVRAIRAVADGKIYVSQGLDVGARGGGPQSTELTSREREVVQLLAEGRTSRDAATHLGVATSTVETHRRQIMAKLGIHSVAELTKYAIRQGLTSIE